MSYFLLLLRGTLRSVICDSYRRLDSGSILILVLCLLVILQSVEGVPYLLCKVYLKVMSFIYSIYPYSSIYNYPHPTPGTYNLIVNDHIPPDNTVTVHIINSIPMYLPSTQLQ